MAITNTTKPYQLHPAFNEVLYVCTSDRYDATANAETNTQVVNSGGFAQYTIGAHTFKVGDVVTGSGFTTSVYNSVQTITAIGATTITTGLAVSTLDTNGTITRTNLNFKMICDVKVDAVTVASMEVTAIGSDFSFDISGILQTEIDNNGGYDIAAVDETDTIVSPSVQNSALNYTLTFTEWYDSALGILMAQDTLNVTTISTADIYAYNIVLQEIGFEVDTFSDYILSGATSKFLTKGILKKKDDEMIQVSFLTEEPTAKLYLKKYDYSGGSITYPYFITTINNNRGTVIIGSSIFGSAVSKADLWIVDGSANIISEVLTVYRDAVKVKNAVRIEFKNRLGGIDAYSFVDAEEVTSTDPTTVNISNVYETLNTRIGNEISLLGKGETSNVIKWLEELYSSRVIFLNNGVKRLRVAIKSASNPIVTRDLRSPKIVIKLSDRKLN